MKIKLNEVKEITNIIDGSSVTRYSVTIYPKDFDESLLITKKKEPTPNEKMVAVITRKLSSNKKALEEWNGFLERNKEIINKLGLQNLRQFILMGLVEIMASIHNERKEYAEKYNEHTKAENLISMISREFFSDMDNQ